MHLTIRKYRKVEGDKKQLIDLVNREFVPLISKIDGFTDFYAFFADDNTLMSVSVFRDAKVPRNRCAPLRSGSTRSSPKCVPRSPR